MYIKLIPLRDVPKWARNDFTQIVTRDADGVLCAVVECDKGEPEAQYAGIDESMLPDAEYDALVDLGK